MSLREAIWNNFKVEFPTKEPLWAPWEGLQAMVVEDEEIKVPHLLTISEQYKRQELYKSMVVRENIVSNNGTILVSNVKGEVKKKVDKIFSNRARYQSISIKFPNPIKWYHIALIHELECSQNFNCYLGNGQRWNKKTTIVPKGRGPFKNFEAGAIDAIKYDNLDKVQDWSIGNALFILEGFNGYGYTKYRGINSPYLWSGSNHYTSGKYVTDSVYSKDAVSSQIGVALLLQEILKRI